MHTINILTSLVAHHQILAYCFIFVGLVFEGEFFVISTGILAHLGALNFWFSLFFIFMGGLGKTVLGYYIGGVINRKWSDSKIVRYLEKRVHHFMPRFQRKPFWSIFLSKFIFGANHIVIIFAGFRKINYRKFLKAEILSTAIWAPLLLSIGYFFSYAALQISHEIWRFLLLILLFIGIFIFLDKLFGSIYELFEELYGNGENHVKQD